jgi:hypothetical protein
MKRLTTAQINAEKRRLGLANQTRQGVHPVVNAATPAPPADARWEVLMWCVEIHTWRHYGYAANERKRQSLASQVRALGGKCTYKAIVPRTGTSAAGGSKPGTGGRRTETRRGGGSTPVVPSAPAISQAELKALLLSSLSLWIREVRDANAVSALPIGPIRAARDACKEIVEERIGEGGYRATNDPFAPFE